ncbi:hypothetical protein I4F81_000121 [Pyropia yezoensis]|uniref:Uncharacterized protein n=1 Tax=Pyropia yezoensis TaxID=2788 RepID=A0ACC3BHZ7_PYRYE|nr:hypothetical protein I4F81_000121 [Neopyropia yezoensis]
MTAGRSRRGRGRGSGGRSLPVTAAAVAVAVAVAVVAAAAAAPRVAAQRWTRTVGGAVVTLAGGGPGGRIVGGRPVTADDATYGGGFYTRLFQPLDATNTQAIYYCGGALIAEDKVLTAAHCFRTRTSAQDAVGDIIQIGGRSFNTGIQKTVGAVAVHPQYVDSGTDLVYDFAILTIANPPTAAEYAAAGIAPAFVNTFSRFPRSGSTKAVVGHGLTDGTNEQSVSSRLLLARVPVNAWSQCNAWWVRRNFPGAVRPATSEALQFCGGLGTRQTTCEGDSGGPVFERFSLPRGEFFSILGVVSYGFEDTRNAANRCGTLNPSYFAKVSIARAFIRANV